MDTEIKALPAAASYPAVAAIIAAIRMLLLETAAASVKVGRVVRVPKHFTHDGYHSVSATLNKGLHDLGILKVSSPRGFHLSKNTQIPPPVTA